jgi:hypothetical protein
MLTSLAVLGGFPLKRNLGDRFSALHTNLFRLRCNEPAKRAHPLCSNFLSPRSEQCQQRFKGLPSGCEPPTQRRTIGFHKFTFAGLSADCANLRPLNNDRAWVAILCRIAHFAPFCGDQTIVERVDVPGFRTEQFRPAIRYSCAHYGS